MAALTITLEAGAITRFAEQVAVDLVALLDGDEFRALDGFSEYVLDHLPDLVDRLPLGLFHDGAVRPDDATVGACDVVLGLRGIGRGELAAALAALNFRREVGHSGVSIVGGVATPTIGRAGSGVESGPATRPAGKQ